MVRHSLTAAGVVLAIMLLAVSPASSQPTPACNIAGATCASRSPSTQRACRNDWVAAQMKEAAPSGIIGADCASRGPANYQACINTWVMQQQASNSPAGAVGTTCASRPPQYQQQCIDAWIDQQMQAQACNKQPTPPPAKCTVSPGAVCAAGNRDCFNRFVSAFQLAPGSVGGCAGVGPQYQDACVADAVNGWQTQALAAVFAGGRTPMGATCATVSPSGRAACAQRFLSDMLRVSKGRCIDGKGASVARAAMAARFPQAQRGASGVGSAMPMPGSSDSDDK